MVVKEMKDLWSLEVAPDTTENGMFNTICNIIKKYKIGWKI